MSRPYHPSLSATLAIHTARHVTEGPVTDADPWCIWTVATPAATTEELIEDSAVRLRVVQIRQFIKRAAVVASAGEPEAGRLSFRTIPETCGDLNWMIGMLHSVPGHLNVWLPRAVYDAYCEAPVICTCGFQGLSMAGESCIVSEVFACGARQIAFRRDETPLRVSPHTDAPDFIFSGDGPLALVLVSPSPSPFRCCVAETVTVKIHAPDKYHKTHTASHDIEFERDSGEPLPCAAFLLALP